MKPSDEWQTPKALFKELDELYGPFFLDACCTRVNCLVDKHKDYLQGGWGVDYLSQIVHDDIQSRRLNWYEDNDSIFMNPPYSNPEPFIKKAWEDAKYFRVVILVPVSILSNKYMDFLDGMKILRKYEGISDSRIRDWLRGIEIVHLSRRVKFEHPTKKVSSPPFACCLIIMDRR